MDKGCFRTHSFSRKLLRFLPFERLWVRSSNAIASQTLTTAGNMAARWAWQCYWQVRELKTKGEVVQWPCNLTDISSWEVYLGYGIRETGLKKMVSESQAKPIGLKYYVSVSPLSFCLWILFSLTRRVCAEDAIDMIPCTSRLLQHEMK